MEKGMPDYHREFAAVYDDVYRDTCSVEADIDVAIKNLDIKPGAVLLDWGCGTGAHAKALARQGYVVDGIDVSPAMIEQANSGAKSQGMTAFCGDIAEYAQQARITPFDGFYSFANVLNCLPHREAMVSSLRAIAGMLHSGACGFVDVWNITPLLQHGTRDTVREFSTPLGHYVQAMNAMLDRESQVLDIEYRLFSQRPTDELWSLVRSRHRLYVLTLQQYFNIFSEAGFDVRRILLQRPRTEEGLATENDRLVSFVLRRV